MTKGTEMKMLLAAFLFLMATGAEAATLESKDAARKLTDQVMAKVAAGDIEGGLMLAKPYTIISDSEFDGALEQARSQFPVMQQRFGKTIGAEFIKEKTVGNSLLKIIHIQKFQKHIIRWHFVFYNPDGKWIINSFHIEDNIRTIFEE